MAASKDPKSCQSLPLATVANEGNGRLDAPFKLPHLFLVPTDASQLQKLCQHRRAGGQEARRGRREEGAVGQQEKSVDWSVVTVTAPGCGGGGPPGPSGT
jgi:hypothetical protein